MRYSHRILRAALAVVAVASVAALAQVPVIRVTTQNGQEPTREEIWTGGGWGGGWGGTSVNMKYVRVTKVEISGASVNTHNITRNNMPDSIRIRGNSTAGMDKKPYRIKFGEKVPMFGKTAAKSWVLLANYFDATFALNAIAFRLGKAMGLEFTPSSQLVELYINNTYRGIYELTEQMQVNPGRVDIRGKKDWFVEFDYHAADADEIKFNTVRYDLPTFIKSPEVESQFNVNNPAITFVVDELNALTNKMAENGFPENGYRNMLDLDSWAKYVLIQQLIDNFDFNSKIQDAAPGSNFCYRDSTGKIKAGPLWDFDLAAGLQGGSDQNLINNNFPLHYKTYQEPVEPKHAFYKRLWEDPVFKAKFKKLWDKHQSDISAIPRFVDSISNVVKGVAKDRDRIGTGDNIWNNDELIMNMCMWNCPPQAEHGPLTLSKFNNEVDSLKSWWTRRVTWFGSQISNFDTSKDIVQTATFNITFNTHGGSNVPAQTVPAGGKVTKPVPDPTRSGCTFGDWYKDSALTKIWNFDTTINSQETIHAKWNGCNTTQPPPQSTNFTVTFNTLSNSAQPVPGAQTVASGQKASKPADMTRQPEGTWRFDGWFTSNGSTNNDWGTLWDFDASTVTADVYLYAKWTNPSGVTLNRHSRIDKNFAAIKNGFVINATSGASVTIYALNGSVVRKHNLKSGSYTVRLGNLPKGMYLVRAVVDGKKMAARAAVR